ncbi:MAG: hypothetical protein LBD54_02565 [Puniceicoccales bacterium]|jgi:hypothetical protein|nr:hypothetical protein [Puniceicoccales bacterium]
MNKKLTSSIAAGLLSAGFLGAEGGFSVPPLSLSSSLSFQTEDVERGHKQGQQVFSPNVRISVSPLEGLELYFRNKNWLGTKKSVHNRHDLTLGASYEVTEIFTVDFGFTTRLWRNIRGQYDRDIQAIDKALRAAQTVTLPTGTNPQGNRTLARLRDLDTAALALRRFRDTTGLHPEATVPLLERNAVGLRQIITTAAGANPAAALEALNVQDPTAAAGTNVTAPLFMDHLLDPLVAANGTPVGRLFGTEDMSSAKAMGIKRHGYEIYLGATANGLLDQPLDLSLYYTYGFTERRNIIEAKGNYLLDLSTFGVNGFSLDIGAGFGWDKKTRPWGMKKNVAQLLLWNNQGMKKSSVYWNLSTALVYDITPNCAAKIGVEYQGLAKKKSWPYEKHRNHVWFTTSFDCNF